MPTIIKTCETFGLRLANIHSDISWEPVVKGTAVFFCSMNRHRTGLRDVEVTPGVLAELSAIIRRHHNNLGPPPLVETQMDGCSFFQIFIGQVPTPRLEAWLSIHVVSRPSAWDTFQYHGMSFGVLYPWVDQWMMKAKALPDTDGDQRTFWDRLGEDL